MIPVGKGGHRPARPVKTECCTTGQVHVFPSMNKAAIYLEGDLSSIWQCCNGKQKKHKGHLISYDKPQ